MGTEREGVVVRLPGGAVLYPGVDAECKSSTRPSLFRFANGGESR